MKSLVKMAKEVTMQAVDRRRESLNVVAAHIYDSLTMQMKLKQMCEFSKRIMAPSVSIATIRSHGQSARYLSHGSREC